MDGGRDEGREGSIVTILCDGGERYAHSYYSDAWYRESGIDTVESDAQIAALAAGEGELALATAGCLQARAATGRAGALQ